MPAALDSVSIDKIRRFVRGSMRYMDAYRVKDGSPPNKPRMQLRYTRGTGAYQLVFYYTVGGCWLDVLRLSHDLT